MTKSKQQINKEKELLHLVLVLRTQLMEERLRALVPPINYKRVLEEVYNWAKEVKCQ